MSLTTMMKLGEMMSNDRDFLGVYIHNSVGSTRLNSIVVIPDK